MTSTQHVRINSPEGAEAIFTQANQGSPRAMRMAAVLNAAGVQGEQNWPTALDWLQAAAQRNESEAQGELVALCHDVGVINHMTLLARQDRSFPTDIWQKLRQGVDLEQLLTAAGSPVSLSEQPQVTALVDMASLHLCAWLRGRGATTLKPAAGFSEMVFELGNTGLPLLALRERIGKLIEVEHLPPTRLRRYAKGQGEPLHVEPELIAHSEAEAAAPSLSLRLFLNEDYAGGHIDFPHLGIAYRGKVGHALIWENTGFGGSRDPRVESSVQPVQEGEQWVLVQPARGPHELG